MKEKALLIVDDEQSYLDLVAECLEDDFPHIDKALDLEKAYDFLKLRKYDCLLVDINLQTGNGAHIIKYCQDNQPQGNDQTPVVVMSGLINDDFIEKFSDKFAGILPKPFRKNDLLAKVLVATGMNSGLKKEVKELQFEEEAPTQINNNSPETAEASDSTTSSTSPSKPSKNVSITLESGEEFDVLAYEPDVSAPFKIVNIEKRVRSQLDKIKKNSTLKNLFSKIKYDPEDPHIIKHIGLLINISTGISKEMDWGSDQTLEKFVFASYLHDISLGDNSKLAKITPFDELKSLGLSAEEEKLVKLHPSVSAKMIETKKDIPPDVMTIIEQHHELPSGGGFPNGYDHKRIIPLSSIFIVSHWLTDMILTDVTWSIEKFISKYKIKAKGPHFRKVFRALEKIK